MLSKTLAKVESLLHLFDASTQAYLFPPETGMGLLNRDIKAAQSYLKRKNYDALLASLQEIHEEAQKIRSLKTLAQQMQPLIGEVAASSIFQQNIQAGKRDILNAFLRLKKPLLALQTLSGNKNLTRMLNELEWGLEELEPALFKVDTGDELAAVARSLAGLSSTLASISIAVTSGEAAQQPLLEKKLKEVVNEWNTLLNFLAVPLRKAYKGLHPSAVFMFSRKAGVEGVEIRS